MEERLLEYLNAAEQTLAAYGPQAVDLALWLGRIGAAQTLIVPIIGLVACIGVWVLAIPKLFTWARNHGDTDAYAVPIILSAILGGVSLICLIPALNIFAWVGIFKPEVWLAYQAFQSVTGG